jgi:hypothetical protein
VVDEAVPVKAPGIYQMQNDERVELFWVRLMQKRSSAPDVFDDVEPNSRGITRGEVEAAIVDWCRLHGDAALCKKLRSE